MCDEPWIGSDAGQVSRVKRGTNGSMMDLSARKCSN